MTVNSCVPLVASGKAERPLIDHERFWKEMRGNWGKLKRVASALCPYGLS